MKTTRIEVSPKTIIFTISFLLLLWFLYQIRSIVAMVFISFILMTAVNPLSEMARKRKIPLILPMLFVYLIVITLLSFVVASLVPAVLEQSKSLLRNTPFYLASLENFLNIKFAPDFASSYFNGVPSNLLRMAGGLFSNLINIFAVFFIAYYLTLERPLLSRYLARFFGDGTAREKKTEALALEIEGRVGGWIRGELFLMAIIGLLTYGSLLLLGIPYALPLGVLAGILEVVPNIGPTIAAIPAVLMGFTVSPLIGLGALSTSIIIQQLENNLIVPRVMQTATGTKPLATLLSLLIGYTLAGVIGAVLAMPFYIIVSAIYAHINNNP